MNDDKTKEVYFDEFCPKCKNTDVDECEEPCNECLGEPFNTESHKPVKFEEK